MRVGAGLPSRLGSAVLAASLVLLLACERGRPCTGCDQLVIAATGEPAALLPPLIFETVGRDIGDQVYERLADLSPAPLRSTRRHSGPRLAARWERVDSPDAPLSAPARCPVARRRAGDRRRCGVLLRGLSATRCSTPWRAGRSTGVSGDGRGLDHGAGPLCPELSRNSCTTPPGTCGSSRPTSGAGMPRDQWAADTAVAHLVGSGPYRLAAWDRGQALTLVADTAGGRAPIAHGHLAFRAPIPTRRLTWSSPHEADLMEALGAPERVARVASDTDAPHSSLSLRRLWLSWLPAGARAAASVLATAALRRALEPWRWTARPRRGRCLARAPRPRPARCRNCSGSGMTAVRTLPYDTAAARGRLRRCGWRRSADGIRVRGRTRLRLRHPGAGDESRSQAAGRGCCRSSGGWLGRRSRSPRWTFRYSRSGWAGDTSTATSAPGWTSRARGAWPINGPRRDRGPQLRRIREPGVRPALRRGAGRGGSAGRAPGLARGDGHPQCRRAGTLPLRAGECGRGLPADAGLHHRSVQLAERVERRSPWEPRA